MRVAVGQIWKAAKTKDGKPRTVMVLNVLDEQVIVWGVESKRRAHIRVNYATGEIVGYVYVEG